MFQLKFHGQCLNFDKLNLYLRPLWEICKKSF